MLLSIALWFALLSVFSLLSKVSGLLKQ